MFIGVLLAVCFGGLQEQRTRISCVRNPLAGRLVSSALLVARHAQQKLFRQKHFTGA
jgi:hypothetical protein